MLAAVATPEWEHREQQQLERAATVLGQGASFACAWSHHAACPFLGVGLERVYLNFARKTLERKDLSDSEATR
jgi:hypothetical protein